MLNLLFPSQFDNVYRGQWVAFWLLIPLVLLKFFMGLNVSGLNPMVDPRYILERADGIALAQFSKEAGDIIVFMFSAWGLALMMIALFGVIALVRYRSMAPLVYLLLGLEQIIRKASSMSVEINRAVEGDLGSPSIWINWALSISLVVGFFLSIWRRRNISTLS